MPAGSETFGRRYATHVIMLVVILPWIEIHGYDRSVTT
jgi:hypothetical protein